jgi:hypothetical protein
MSAEGMPRTEPSLLSRPLAWLTRLIVRFPLPVLALGLAAAVGAVVVSYQQLKFHTNRDDVLNPSSDYNRRWIQYTKEFGDEEDVVVVVEGTAREAIVPALDEIAAAVQRDNRHFHMVMHKVDLSGLHAKGLHYLKPGGLATIDGFLTQVDPILAGDWSQLSLAAMAGRMANMANVPGACNMGTPPGGAGAAPSQAELMARQCQAKWMSSLAGALTQQGPYQSPWPEMSALPEGMDDLSADPCRYILLNDGRLGLVELRFVPLDKDSENFAQNSGAVDALRGIVAQAKAGHPGLKIGITGLPVMENDEMRVSQSAMTIITFLSLGGIFLVLVAGFGGLRHAALTTLALVLGTVWTVGFTTLTVGYLNILSIAFGSILMGLGINYGIYYAARYMQLCETSESTGEALVKAAASVGPSITIGSLTAACSFFTTAFTDFKGVSQLGIIAGGGILLCWLAAMTMLPALIVLFDAHSFGRRPSPPLDIYAGLRPLYFKPRLTLVLIVAATAALATGIGKLWYDDNLLNLQPIGLESVELEHKLLTETNQSAWFALSVAKDQAEVLQRKAAFSRLPTVERVEELASLFPADEEQNWPIVERIHSRLLNLPAQAPQIPVPPPAQLGQILAGMWTSAAGRLPAEQAAAMGQLGQALRRLPPEELARRLADFQQRVAGDLLLRLRMLQSASNPQPPTLGDLPDSLVGRFIGHSGKFLMKIYSKKDIWDLATRERFVHDIRSVDPEATGNPLQVYEASRHMKRSYEQAAVYALIAIMAVLVLEFRNLIYPLLAMLPLAAGVLQMCGLMGMLNIPLNSANMIVLPLILGLGAENGIHIVNDFRRRSSRYHRMSAATTTAVIINSLTTMVGFAALMVASHQGLQSLGRVLTIGMSCCLLSALVLPNLFLLWSEGKQVAYDEAEEGPARIVPTPVPELESNVVPRPHFMPIRRRTGEEVGVES